MERRIKLFFVLSITVLLSLFTIQAHRNSDEFDAVEAFSVQIDEMYKNEKWQEIVNLGEKAAKQCRKHHDEQQEFKIVDQLVSFYFRLGDFEKAQENAERLLVLGPSLKSTDLITKSFYKFSIALRGAAGIESHHDKKRQLYDKARSYAAQALKHCPNHRALKARVLFHTGAVECDDPYGDRMKGIAMYQEALTLFTALREKEYKQRVLIRLGTAFLSLGEIKRSRDVVEELKKSSLRERTHMHLHYLEALVLKKENRFNEALKKTKEGKQIAVKLHANADLQRFENLMNSLKPDNFVALLQ